VRSCGADAPALYYVTMPPGAMLAVVQAAAARGWTPPPKGFWSLEPAAYGLHAEPPTLVVDVEAWVARKLAAIRCHTTQMGAGHPFDAVGEAGARRWLGREHFHRAGVGGREPVLERLSVLR
jgi:LmbE family N-acetylglucosaminyl deacetylase